MPETTNEQPGDTIYFGNHLNGLMRAEVEQNIGGDLYCGTIERCISPRGYHRWEPLPVQDREKYLNVKHFDNALEADQDLKVGVARAFGVPHNP